MTRLTSTCPTGEVIACTVGQRRSRCKYRLRPQFRSVDPSRRRTAGEAAGRGRTANLRGDQHAESPHRADLREPLLSVRQVVRLQLCSHMSQTCLSLCVAAVLRICSARGRTDPASQDLEKISHENHRRINQPSCKFEIQLQLIPCCYNSSQP